MAYRARIGFVLCWLSLSCTDEAAPGGPVGVAGSASSAGTSGAAGAGTGGALAGAAGSAAAGASAMGGAGAPNAGTSGQSGAGGSMGGASGSAGTGGITGGAGGAGGSAGAAAELSDFQLYGRWDTRTAGKAITVNSGSHVTARFSGTGISAKFDISGNTGAIPTVSIRIDQGELVEKEIAATLQLASGLAAGEHELTLFVRGMNENDSRWAPPLVASTTFLGLTVDGGNLVKTPRPMRLKIEFLGDSITEGVAVHDKGPAGQSSANWRCDGARNYASLTAQKLGVEWRQVGFGRQGLTVGGNGGVPKAQDAFNWFYQNAPRDAWQADVVVINQGTNDRATKGDAFAPLYKNFLGVVRKAYPAAKIVALRPLVGDFGAEISAQVAALKADGDAKLYYVDTGGWTEPGDFTDGVHPNQPGSVKISEKLAAALMPIIQ